MQNARLQWKWSRHNRDCSNENAKTYSQKETRYVAVDPEHQGRQLSSRIAALLVSQYKGRLFATTYHDRMKRTLARAGFVQKGNQWKSKNEKDMLSFWEKE